jgi:hypothetical protein
MGAFFISLHFFIILILIEYFFQKKCTQITYYRTFLKYKSILKSTL